MTQPPNQPPNQPPQGGFGPPQDQPAHGGGFGAPQPPPQSPPTPPAQPPQPQPGYGYPQQPGPYAQPGPYGAPPAGPGAQGPYGAPQPGPNAPQPGYGYPQQPQYPGGPGMPPPAGGPGGGPAGRGRTALIIGAAAAALLVIGGTVYAVTSGDDGGQKKPVAQQSGDGKHSASDAPVNPGDGSGDGGADPENLNDGRKPGESKVLWYKTAPDAPGSGADAPGMWITGRTAVKAAYKQLFAYRVGNGDPAWDPIGFPQKICAVSPQSDDGKIVVAYMSGVSDRAKCNQLQQVDLDTGKKGWSGQVGEGALFDSTLSLELTVSGRTLMVGRSQSGTAYDVDSGKKLYDKKKYGSACFPTAFAGGSGRLVQVASCGAGTGTEHDEIQELDAATGKVKWTQPVKKGWTVARTYSLNPLVVYLTNEKKKAWNISAFTDAGKFRSEVKVDEKFAPGCGWAILERDLQGCNGVTVDADTLYLPTAATTGPNEIVAISLATGKEKWRVKSPADESMSPLKTEGGRLIAYVQPSYDKGGQVVAVPTAGGSHTPVKLLQNPAGTAQIENSFFDGAVAWADGRFFISSTRLSGNDDAKEKLMMAFGK
ncbi:hypothetical protein AQJ66_09590 [Streptomyces bungoensis]|uniref:Pyrrolo-quinoline quinone repeat domain-containing protein n=1 Tax=Streptomyces bungoensis TaxID=285568 RepID=A0A101T8H4_9ACTN|nr:PQQ-binding-like beta-propeller repeat protein [Streptomyces bungoensis]KUN87860.1 hypothetical protein AQJ66_09590 [Streptomyces bungoensis]